MHLIDRKRHISYEYLKNVIYSFNIYYSIVPHHWLTLPFNKYLSLDHLYGRQLCELDFIAKGHVVHVYIPLKIKPNSVRIRSLSWQIFILPSTGFKLVDTLQHQSLSLMSNALDHSATSAISIYTYINLYLWKLNASVRIRSLSWQIVVLPSTGFELTQLIHYSTIHLALRPAP